MELLHNPENFKLYNDVLIMAEKESEDIIEGKNLKLYKDTSNRKNESKRIFGKVVAVPYKLSRTRIHQEDSMFPKGTQSFSGDIIRMQIIAYENRIGRMLLVKEKTKFKDRYVSSPYEPVFTRNNDQEIAAEVGDTAWFHYLVLSDERYVGQDEQHNRYYSVPYETIFCFTNKNKFHLVNGYVFVTPYFDESFEEIDVGGKKVRGKLKGNLVVALKESPEYLTGVIASKGQCFGTDTRSTLKVGDIVLYAKGSEFENAIEGKEVMIMHQWRIIAKKEGNTFIPVGDYVHLRTRRIPPRKIVLVDHQYNEIGGMIEDIVDVKKTLDYLVEPVADLIASGENCKHLNGSQKQVYFNTKTSAFNLEDTIFIKEGDVMAEVEGEWKTNVEARIRV